MSAFHYQVYGLAVSCDVPLQELRVCARPAAGSPDVVARFRGVERPPETPLDWMPLGDPSQERPVYQWARSAEGRHLRFFDLVEFTISDEGRVVTVSPQPDTSPETVRHLFLDQVLPLVVNLRGGEALHAGAVEVAGRAVVFLGCSGTGKSTLVASFAGAGHPPVSDDCVALRLEGPSVLAVPAYPGLRLWPASVAAVIPGVPAEPVSELSEKVRVAEGAAGRLSPREELPIAAIYDLQRDPGFAAPSSEPLSGQEALMALVSSAFRLDIDDPRMLERQLGFMHLVAGRVPVRRLRIPEDYRALPAVREAVLADLPGSGPGPIG